MPGAHPLTKFLRNLASNLHVPTLKHRRHGPDSERTSVTSLNALTSPLDGTGDTYAQALFTGVDMVEVGNTSLTDGLSVFMSALDEVATLHPFIAGRYYVVSSKCLVTRHFLQLRL
jgi:hypothetical protein